MASVRAERVEELQSRLRAAELGGGVERVKRQHEAGKLTARERVLLLLDPGSFAEIDALVTHRCRDFGMEKSIIPGDGVVCGYGTVDGRLVYVFAQDFTVFGGSLSETNARKICKVMDLALENGAPILGLNDSGGARIQEGVASLGGYADIFLRNTLASGVVPQISAILGPCAGGAVYSPAITDFIFMVEGTSYMFVTGPEVIKTVTHEEVTMEELGGASTHSAKSGVCHLTVASDAACLLAIRELLSYLPSNNLDDPPAGTSEDDPDREVRGPEHPGAGRSQQALRHQAADRGGGRRRQVLRDPRRLRPQPGRRLRPLRQPERGDRRQPAGLPRRGARHRRLAQRGALRPLLRRLQLPLVTFEDVPGFLPGTQQEFGGIIKHGAKLLFAYAEATVPKITVITRKAYGGAYCVMSSKHLRTDVNFAYPTAEIAVMGPEGAVNILYRREIEEAADPAARRQEKVAEYRARFSSPYIAAERGFVDAIIEPQADPAGDRPRPAPAGVQAGQRAAKKHGNIPL